MINGINNDLVFFFFDLTGITRNGVIKHSKLENPTAVCQWEVSFGFIEVNGGYFPARRTLCLMTPEGIHCRL